MVLGPKGTQISAGSWFLKLSLYLVVFFNNGLGGIFGGDGAAAHTQALPAVSWLPQTGKTGLMDRILAVAPLSFEYCGLCGEEQPWPPVGAFV